MRPQRTLVGLVLGLAAFAASAQAPATLRWRTGAPLGLQLPANDWRAPCGSVAFPCNGAGTVRLYTSETAPRSVSLQLAEPAASGALRMERPQGLNVSLLGKAGIAPDLGVYGRVGTIARAAPGWAGVAGGEGGVTYGVGLSWDFSRRGSAMVGWDSYDVRGAGGETRDVRATSLGLQWRY